MAVGHLFAANHMAVGDLFTARHVAVGHFFAAIHMAVVHLFAAGAAASCCFTGIKVFIIFLGTHRRGGWRRLRRKEYRYRYQLEDDGALERAVGAHNETVVATAADDVAGPVVRVEGLLGHHLFQLRLRQLNYPWVHLLYRYHWPSHQLASSASTGQGISQFSSNASTGQGTSQQTVRCVENRGFGIAGAGTGGGVRGGVGEGGVGEGGGREGRGGGDGVGVGHRFFLHPL